MRYHGYIGYVIPHETPNPYVDKTDIREFEVAGTVESYRLAAWDNRTQAGGVTMGTSIRFAFRPEYDRYLPYIRYATYRGLKWIVNSTTFDGPDLVIDLGGLWNG